MQEETTTTKATTILSTTTSSTTKANWIFDGNNIVIFQMSIILIMAFIIFSMWVSKYCRRVIDRHRIGRHGDNDANVCSNKAGDRPPIVPTDRIMESNDSIIKQILSPKNSFYDILHSDTNITQVTANANTVNAIEGVKIETGDTMVESQNPNESMPNRQAAKKLRAPSPNTKHHRNTPKMKMRRSMGGVMDNHSFTIDLPMEVISPPLYDGYRLEIDELVKANRSMKKKAMTTTQVCMNNVKRFLGFKGTK